MRSKNEATASPFRRTTTRNNVPKTVSARPQYPALRNSSGCGSEPDGDSKMTEEVMSAIEPASKSRSTTYTAICELSGRPVFFETRYGRTRSAKRPIKATAVKPITCVPSSDSGDSFFLCRTSQAQRTDRTR